MSRDQQDTHGFGICVKGGKDSGHGVYVSRIEEGSLAERAGLRPGDSILEVNGTPFTSVSHDEALKVLFFCSKLFFPKTLIHSGIHYALSLQLHKIEQFPFTISISQFNCID